MADDHAPEEVLESREPSLEDLVELCRHLNQAGARYLIIGGFAMRAAGYDRRTMDIDLMIEPGVENEALVIKALSYLPDNAASELTPGEVEEHAVVRVADEIVIDLMTSASGVSFAEAAPNVEIRHINGVAVPFASAELLWKMKGGSLRDKDQGDIHFLRHLRER